MSDVLGAIGISAFFVLFAAFLYTVPEWTVRRILGVGFVDSFYEMIILIFATSVVFWTGMMYAINRVVRDGLLCSPH